MGQGVDVDGLGQKNPAGQTGSGGPMDPGGQKLPTPTHGTQTSPLKNSPRAHGVHVVAPLGAFVCDPLGQVSHSVDPNVGVNVPFVQLLHSTEPKVVDTWPGRHSFEIPSTQNDPSRQNAHSI